MNIQQLRAQIAALQDATMDENKNFRTAYDEGKFDALSAVDTLLDSLQEEPVAPKVLEDMLNAKTAAESLGISQKEHDRIVDELIYGKEPELVDDLSNKEKEPASEDLEEAANDYAHDLLHDDVFETFIAGAQWQKGKTLSDVKKAVTGKMFQFTMNNVEARGDDPNGKTVTLEGSVTFHINNPESIIDALIMELENNN